MPNHLSIQKVINLNLYISIFQLINWFIILFLSGILGLYATYVLVNGYFMLSWIETFTSFKHEDELYNKKPFKRAIRIVWIIGPLRGVQHPLRMIITAQHPPAVTRSICLRNTRLISRLPGASVSAIMNCTFKVKRGHSNLWGWQSSP